MTRALTIKQRKFVKHYVETGNATQAALIAYDTTNPHTASAIAAETLEKPGVQQAIAALLDGHGLSDAKLAAIHAHYLALYQSPDPQEKALVLKALDMAYRLKGAYVASREDEEVSVYALVHQMTLAELHDFRERKNFPERHHTVQTVVVKLVLLLDAPLHLRDKALPLRLPCRDEGHTLRLALHCRVEAFYDGPRPDRGRWLARVKLMRRECQNPRRECVRWGHQRGDSYQEEAAYHVHACISLGLSPPSSHG